MQLTAESTLTLDEAIRRFLAQSPEIGAARERVEAARGDLRQAAAFPNPVVHFSREKSYQTAVRVRDHLEASRRRLQQPFEQPDPGGRVALAAPLTGSIVEIRAVSGSFVEAGQQLFRMVDPSRLWIWGRLRQDDLRHLSAIQSATLELSDQPRVELEGSQLVNLGLTMDAATRTVPVIFELPNPQGTFRLGALGRLSIRTGRPSTVLAVPRSAVLLEENKKVVYIQLDGESFERRVLQTGIEDGDWVEVRDGLELGDRVVTVGAYEVALASRSTQAPAHGHTH